MLRSKLSNYTPNEAFLNAVSRHLDDVTAARPDRLVRDYLRLSVERVMKNHPPQILGMTSKFKEDIAHIVDWLDAAITNNEAWLAKLDHQGRPKKLMKFSTLSQVSKEADKAMLKASQRSLGLKIVEGDEKLVRHLTNGFYVVQLVTERALDNESAKMQHCIGNGAYDRHLNDQKHQFLSLRDAAGNPHATLEVINNKVVQLQGKQNRQPIKKYIEQIVTLMEAQGYGLMMETARLGFVQDAQGNRHDVDNLPDGLTVLGNLTLSEIDIQSLPDNMVIDGDLRLFRLPNLKVLPKGLTVKGSLDIGMCSISSLPDDIALDGNLTLAKTNVETLPPSMCIKGNLSITLGEKFSLKKSNRIDGDIRISHVKHISVPDGIVVNGRLDILFGKTFVFPENATFHKSCRIEHIENDDAPMVIPKGTVFGESLTVADASLLELPANLQIGRNLVLVDAKLKALPENLSIGGHLVVSEYQEKVLADVAGGLIVRGNAGISPSKLKTIGDNITVHGDLDLRGAEIVQLPSNLKVGKTLDIRETKVDKLPNDLEFGGDLLIDGNMIAQFPDASSFRKT